MHWDGHLGCRGLGHVELDTIHLEQGALRGGCINSSLDFIILARNRNPVAKIGITEKEFVLGQVPSNGA